MDSRPPALYFFDTAPAGLSEEGRLVEARFDEGEGKERGGDRQEEIREADEAQDLLKNFESESERAREAEAMEEADDLLGDFDKEAEQARMAEAEREENRARERWAKIKEQGARIRAAAEGLRQKEGTSMATGLQELEETWGRMLRGEELRGHRNGSEELWVKITEEVDTMWGKIDKLEETGRALAERVMKQRGLGTGGHTAEAIEAKFWMRLLGPTLEATRRVEGWWAEAMRASAVAADRT